MADECDLLQQLEDRFFQVNVTDGSAGTDLTAGSIMAWDTASDNTAELSSADGELFAGILMSDKKGGDGSTTVAVSRKSVWNIKITTGGSAVQGIPVKIHGANLINKADDVSTTGSSEQVGIALAAGTSNETIPVLVGG